MQQEDRKHLILGITGGIGHAVAMALHKRGIRAKALVRNPQKAQKYIAELANIELLQGDAANIPDLEKAFEGIDTVYYCINIPYPQWSENAYDLLSVSIQLATKLGVRFVFPGNVYVYGQTQKNPVDEKHPWAAHTKKGQIRIKMEELIRRQHQKHNLSYAIIRMPDFYGPFVINGFSEQLFINALKGKSMRWIGNLEVETEFIFIEDGGEAMVLAALDKEFNNHEYNVPGYQPVKARQFLSNISELARKNSKITTMNTDLLFSVIGLFMPIIREVKEMLYLKRERLLLDGSAFLKKFPNYKPHNYNQGIESTLQWARKYYEF